MCATIGSSPVCPCNPGGERRGNVLSLSDWLLIWLAAADWLKQWLAEKLPFGHPGVCGRFGLASSYGFVTISGPYSDWLRSLVPDHTIGWNYLRLKKRSGSKRYPWVDPRSGSTCHVNHIRAKLLARPNVIFFLNRHIGNVTTECHQEPWPRRSRTTEASLIQERLQVQFIPWRWGRNFFNPLIDWFLAFMSNCRDRIVDSPNQFQLINVVQILRSKSKFGAELRQHVHPYYK